MYEPGTILALREPKTDDDHTYPYDRVRVVGQSPVQHATASTSSWAGADAIGCIITPEGDFGATLDKPYGELAQLYDIEAYPTDPSTGEPITPENNPRHLPTPEQVFAKEAANQPTPPPRQKAPHAQDDRKTPEQVLREQAPPKPRGKRG